MVAGSPMPPGPSRSSAAVTDSRTVTLSVCGKRAYPAAANSVSAASPTGTVMSTGASAACSSAPTSKTGATAKTKSG